MKKFVVILCAVCFVGCASTDPYTGEKKTSNAARNGGIGAVVGAVLGAAASSKKDRGRGALTGALVGGAIGGGVGHYMDKQEEVMRDKLQGSGVQVHREGNNLNLIMPGNITFATNRAEIRADFFDVLSSVTAVLKEYDKTNVRISGHTDSTGSDKVNQKLSEDRAASVRSYFVSQQIRYNRIDAAGYGSHSPIASNSTEQGRQANRRVEIQLIPVE